MVFLQLYYSFLLIHYGIILRILQCGRLNGRFGKRLGSEWEVVG
jgi:hypothetical protein